MILRLFKSISVALIVIFFVLIGYQLIMAKGAKEKYDPENTPVIRIADMTLLIPVGFTNFKYGITHGGYEQLEFTLDVDTFKTTKPDYSNDGRTISVEIRPINAPESGEKNYWTENDPVHGLVKRDCQSITRQNMNYEVCNFEGKKRITSYGYIDKRAIYNKASKEYISMFGCTEKSENLNQICVARSKILDSIQAEYSYLAGHYKRAIEIDFAIRDLIESMYQPSHEGEAP